MANIPLETDTRNQTEILDSNKTEALSKEQSVKSNVETLHFPKRDERKIAREHHSHHFTNRADNKGENYD